MQAVVRRLSVSVDYLPRGRWDIAGTLFSIKYDLADGRPANGVWVVPYKTEDKRGDISNVVAEAAVYSLLLHAENENKTRKNNVWPVGEQWTEGKY
jgi:hypothetical protein